MDLDCLVATTYSASLNTVLTLPAAMLLDGPDGSDRKPDTFTAADLAALKRVCSRTTIFCQGGAIHPAERLSPAIIEAEEMVQQVTAPNGGSFHPKVWVMRFRQGTGKSLLRVAVMSRNLTGDDSWDTGIVLESGGVLPKAARNDLGALLRMLPARCVRALPKKRLDLIEALALEVEKVKWKAPADVGGPTFHVTGNEPDSGWVQPPSDRLAILSPFLSVRAVRTLARSTKARPLIVSRKDAFDDCWSALHDQFERKMVLAAPDEANEGGRAPQLHAKMLIWERRKRVHLAIGSMNATNAALEGRNVEFMVSLDCTKAMNGSVDALLDHNNLGNVLEDFAPDPDRVSSDTPPDDRAARAYLLDADLHIQCEPTDAGWQISLVPCTSYTDIISYLPNLRFRPVTLANVRQTSCDQALADGRPATLPFLIDLAQVTGFISFEADGRDGPIAFVLNLEVRGVADEDRRHAALKSLLPDERSFDDFLRILLGDFAALAAMTPGLDADQHPTAWRSGGHVGLLELLVRCAADDPDRLQSIRKTLEAFQPDEFESVTSPDFRRLWESLLEITDPA